MKPVNIKLEVADLEKSGEKYETQVTRIDEPFHKHIYIPLLGKHYVKDRDNNWFEGECDICPKTL